MAFHMKKALICSKSKSFDELYKINGINKLRKEDVIKQIIDLYKQSLDEGFNYKNYNLEEQLSLKKISQLILN